MSNVIEAAVSALQARLNGGFDGIAKFVVSGEGALMIDGTGVRAGDEDASITDWEGRMRTWQRWQRLDREQRGILWNESPF